ncbi:hypothetical protein ACQ4PT_003195 [Festuca glaucescens]
MKPADECLLKSRFAAGRLNDVVLGMAKDRKDHIRLQGWVNLLQIGSFSAPEGLLEWIIDRINPELGEFRNQRNNTSILFTKDMFVKVLGLPPGNRPVVLTGKHQESAHREFYKIEYNHGRRAPIHHAIDLLDNGKLDEETYFRTFFEVALGTYLCPGTGNMLPLEYLGSLDDSSQVKDYDWGAHILQNVMSEVDAFQKKKANNMLQNEPKKIWVGSCLPVLAIIYMDHLDFPESCLSAHHIDYSLPRASHVSDADFKFVMKHDKSRLTLNAHSYGARPFRPFHMTPYANQHAPFGHQPHQLPLVNDPQPPEPSNIPVPNELPDFMIPIIEMHTQLWAKDIEDTNTMLMKKHSTRMFTFARDVISAMKNHTTPTPSFASPPRDASVSILHQPEGSASKATPETQFWNEAVEIAQEVERSKEKSSCQLQMHHTSRATTSAQTNKDQGTSHHTYYDIEPPSFSLFASGEGWSQPTPLPADNVEQVDVVTTGVGPASTGPIPHSPSQEPDQVTTHEQEQAVSLGIDQSASLEHDAAASHRKDAVAPTTSVQNTTTGTSITGAPTAPSHEEDHTASHEQELAASRELDQGPSVEHARCGSFQQEPDAAPKGKMQMTY